MPIELTSKKTNIAAAHQACALCAKCHLGQIHSQQPYFNTSGADINLPGDALEKSTRAKETHAEMEKENE